MLLTSLKGARILLREWGIGGRGAAQLRLAY